MLRTSTSASFDPYGGQPRQKETWFGGRVETPQSSKSISQSMRKIKELSSEFDELNTCLLQK